MFLDNEESNQYTLVEVVDILNRMLFPTPRCNSMDFVLDMLEYSYQLREWLVSLCEEILLVIDVKEDVGHSLRNIISSHKKAESSLKFNTIILLLKKLHIHETNLTESAIDRPETFKLCDIYFPDNADNVQRRTEVKYYARLAKKLTKALKKANKSEAEIRNEVYLNKELNKVKAIALDATTEPLRGYLYECLSDWNYVHDTYNVVQRSTTINTGHTINESFKMPHKRKRVV